MRKFLPLVLSVTVFFAATAGGRPSGADMTEAMHAMFLSAGGAHDRAAERFAGLAEKLRSADLMREAYREALNGANNRRHALLYARHWHALGGGSAALQAQAHLLLISGQWREAESVLTGLMESGGQDDEKLFHLLQQVQVEKQVAVALGKKLLTNTAGGNIFLARLALAAADWPAAAAAIERGLAHRARQEELYLLRMQLLAAREGAAAALPVLADYLEQGCPGLADGCAEQTVLHAFVLLVAGRDDWYEALHNYAGVGEAAALSSGRFFERINMPERAAPYYKRVRGRFFHANLGLARIARDAGNLSEALAVLESTVVADNDEFTLREITVADIIQELQGTEAALARLEAAHLISPDNHGLIYRHALVAEAAGDVDGAIALLERITRLFPNSAEGWNALGYVLADHNRQLLQAERYIKIALRLNPQEANFLDSLGWVYYRLGRLEEARAYLSQAAARSESGEIAAHLGEVVWQLGDYVRAREIFSRTRQHDPDNKVLNETLQRLQVE